MFGQDWIALSQINAASKCLFSMRAVATQSFSFSVSADVGVEQVSSDMHYVSSSLSNITTHENLGEPHNEEPLKHANVLPFADSVTNPSSSINIIDNLLTPEQLRSRGLRVVEDNLYRKKQSGIRLSLFDSPESSLSQLATLHGISDNEESYVHDRMALIHHIIHSHCFHVVEVVNQESRSACKHISAGFSSIRDLSDAVVDSLLQYKDNMSKLPPQKLVDIVTAIDHQHSQPAVNGPNHHKRRDCIQCLKAFRNTERLTETQIRDTFSTQFEQMSHASAANVAAHHGIAVDSSLKKEEIKDLIIDHFVRGRCMKDPGLFGSKVDPTNLCARAVSEFFSQNDIPHSPDLFNAYAISCGIKSLSSKAARHLAHSLNIAYKPEDKKATVVNCIRTWLQTTMKGKSTLSSFQTNEHTAEANTDLRIKWPQLVSANSKAQMVSLFKELTSSKELACVTCTSCSLSVKKRNAESVSTLQLNLQCLKQPDLFETLPSTEARWLDCNVDPPLMLFADGPLKDVLVDPAGVC